MRRFFGRILGDRRVAGGLFLILELIAVMWGVGWMSERWPSVTAGAHHSQLCHRGLARPQVRQSDL